MANFEPILDATFSFEGGYDARANDSGNWNSLGQLVGTNHGISAPLYEDYIKRPPTAADMQAITPEIARNIYKKRFWDKLPGDPIKSQSVAHIIFDGYVNSGGTMMKVVRPAINRVAGREVVPFNTKTFNAAEVEAINKLPAAKLFDEIKQARIAFYENLVASNPEKYGIYRNGWLNRINAFVFEDSATELIFFPQRVLLRAWKDKKKRPYVIGGFLLVAGVTTTAIYLTRKK